MYEPIHEKCPLPESLYCSSVADCTTRREITLITVNSNAPEEPTVMKLWIPACAAQSAETATEFIKSMIRPIVPSGHVTTWQEGVCILLGTDANRLRKEFGTDVERDDPDYLLTFGMDEEIDT